MTREQLSVTPQYVEQRYEAGYRHWINDQTTEALVHFQEAAQHGHPLAYIWLEKIYQTGQQ